MKIIVVHGGRHGATRSISLSPLGRTLLSVCLIGIPALIGGVTGYYIGTYDPAAVINERAAQTWRERLAEQRLSLEEAKKLADEQIQGLTVKVAEMQARLVRLDALGERLVAESDFTEGEFDFSRPPAVGGPHVSADAEIQHNSLDFVQVIDELSERIDNRWMQLNTLQDMLAEEDHARESFVSGRPVKWGWLSSEYGRRTDPFTGKIAWHNGVDFAGKDGSEIIAVAAGVVTWSGERFGYGQMVEINHGDGFITRYAHNKQNIVKVGDIVKKGEVLALMGTTGRSTGPHVHFEVYKHGRAVDPASYIRRTYR